MRTPDRDRCGPAFAALCAALVIALAAIPAAAALSAEYIVLPNGTAYDAAVEIADTDHYEFADTGFMGESIPLQAVNVGLTGNCSPCQFNWSRPWGAPAKITFKKGNYTVSYRAPLHDNDLQIVFARPYHVNVTIPQEFDVTNPLLAGLSQGANVTRHADNTTTVQWNKSYTFDVRFYDPWREELLWFFIQFMAILAVVLVVIPYVFSMRKAE
jgi:hypothetical protein